MGLHLVSEDEIIDMLGLKSRNPIGVDSIREGIKRAFKKGIFEDISIDVSDGDSPNVIVRIIEKEFIKKIYLDGDYQISGKLIRDLFSFKEDQIMREDLIEKAKIAMKEKLLFLGFPEASVDIRTERVSEPYKVNLFLTINTGRPTVIKKVTVKNQKAVPENLLRIEPGDIYNQKEVVKALDRIRERLKKDGYYKPAVGPYMFSDGELEVVINPGKLMNIAIEGNSQISTKRLLKEITFFETESFNDDAVDESASRMHSLYHSEGYPFAQIAPVIKSDAEQILVSYFIHEGRRIRINSVKFIGVTLSPESLRNIMSLNVKANYNPDLIERDKDSLKDFYGALGYLDAGISEIRAEIDENSEIADITVIVSEGQKSVIASLDITGVSSDMQAKLIPITGIKIGDPYNEVDISNARFRIYDFYSNAGYSNIDVVVSRNIDNYMVSLIFNIQEGRLKTIGKTVISGNRKTKYEVIKRELRYNEEKPYSLKEVANERQKLYKLGLFTDVEIEPFNSSENKNDILVKVTEGNAGSVEFGFGYGDYEKYRGFIEVNYRNLWGMNRQGMIRTEVSSLERRILAQYYEPWFLGKQLPFRMSLLHENKTELSLPEREVRYKLNRNTFTAGVEKKLTDRLKTDFYYEYSVVNTQNVKPDVILSKEDVGTLAISSIKPSIIYDSRDNPFEPSDGILSGITLKIASPVLFSETFFSKLTLYSSMFKRLHKRMVLAVSLRGGIAFGLGQTDGLPIVERFFLGGSSTVRGYEQDTLGPKGADGTPTGGDAFFMGSLELRTDIGRGFSLVPFIDAGNVWVNAGDFSAINPKYTAGMGLRYTTPVGPLRVDYGRKINRDPGESSGVLHFSIGHAF